MENKLNVSINKEKLEVVMIREFNAPRELVWKAHTTADMVEKWWGIENVQTIVDKMDFKDGGDWRYVHKQKDGNEYAFNGKFSNIKEPEQFTWTFNFEPIGPGHEITETYAFEELENGRTQLIATSHYNNIEDLEGMIKSGMEGGATETMNRLDKFLAEYVENNA